MPYTDSPAAGAENHPSETVMSGWISRPALARELGLSEDTLRRWETLRRGPPCIRAGRKVFYRRRAIEDWLEPIPFGGDTDPENPVYEGMLESARIKRDKQAITTEAMFKDYDLYLNYMRGGPGFGDPLDREPQSVADDVNGGYLLPRFAESVYGVILHNAGDGQKGVDTAATDARRRAIRKARLAESVPTQEWMAEERQRILDKDAGLQVQQMFAASFKLGPRFEKDFRKFWDLPDDWKLMEADLPIPSYGREYSMDVSELPDVKTVQFVEE